MLILWAAVLPFGSGCASRDLRPFADDVPERRSRKWDAHEWTEVLRANVREGLVDYQHLATHRQALDKFLGRLSVEGPKRTHDLFPTRSDRIAYWINAHNALALRLVLEQYPTDTVYGLAGPTFDGAYRFLIDGSLKSLVDIRQELEAEAQHDPRWVFCLCAAARGCPPLSPNPFRGFDLERRLDEAARAAMENPALVKVDNVTLKLRVSLDVFSRRDAFIAYYQKRHRTRRGDLLSALRSFAGPGGRAKFGSASGYEVRQLPFDRRLNEWKPRGG